VEYFDIDNIDKKFYNVGSLSSDVVNLLGLNSTVNTPILFSDDKIKYTLKHSHEFDSYEQYKACVEAIPDIISNPDYIAKHPNGESIEYIKTLDKLVLVAIRIKQSGNLWVKSFYPITQAKLQLYIDDGTVKKIAK
jgi:hypothetical protein